MTQLALAVFGLSLVVSGLVVGALTLGAIEGARRVFLGRCDATRAIAREDDHQLACPMCGDRCCVQAADA